MRNTRLRAVTILFALLVFAVPVHAVQPDEVLDDPALEERARELGKILRCVVCQNQSIDDSNAPLARDLRVLVRERLQAGDSNDEAIDFIVARYGNFVLLKPPMQLSTYLLWFGPALIFMLAAFAYWTLVRRKPAAESIQTSDALSDAERRELKDILDEGRTP